MISMSSHSDSLAGTMMGGGVVASNLRTFDQVISKYLFSKDQVTYIGAGAAAGGGASGGGYLQTIVLISSSSSSSDRWNLTMMLLMNRRGASCIMIKERYEMGGPTNWIRPGKHPKNDLVLGLPASCRNPSVGCAARNTSDHPHRTCTGWSDHNLCRWPHDMGHCSWASQSFRPIHMTGKLHRQETRKVNLVIKLKYDVI